MSVGEINVKSINETFNDEDHDKMREHKDFLQMNWHDYLLAVTEFARSESEAFHIFKNNHSRGKT